MRTLKLLTPPLSGPDVAAWQRFLAKKSLYRTPVDGVFGRQTVEATALYQKSVGLAADGIVGEQTITKAKAQGYMGLHPATHQNAVTTDRQPYEVRAGVVLSDTMRPIVASLAHDFFAQTGKRLIVTSGTRTAESQAKAMKDKILLKDDLSSLYSNTDALEEILDAYQCAPDGKGEQAMVDVIRRQMSRGVFISRHLTGEGVDFHTPSGGANRVFRSILSDRDDLRVIPEGKPPHIHIQLKRASIK